VWRRPASGTRQAADADVIVTMMVHYVSWRPLYMRSMTRMIHCTPAHGTRSGSQSGGGGASMGHGADATRRAPARVTVAVLESLRSSSASQSASASASAGG
jgi:hypothetical protein